MQTIAIISEKGGVAKSTTTVSLAGCFVQRGRRVLVIDTDPQGTLTKSLIGPAKARALPAARTIAGLFDDSFLPVESIIMPTRFPGLALAPAERKSLKPINCLQPSMPEFGTGQFVLRGFLGEVGAAFDLALIDSPPGLEFCAWAAMAAADAVLIPTYADADGLESVHVTVAEVARVQAAVNPGLKLLGILLARQKKHATHVSYTRNLQLDFPALVFESQIPDAAVFVEARDAQTPVSIFRPRNAGAKAIALVADEIERRLERTNIKAA